MSTDARPARGTSHARQWKGHGGGFLVKLAIMAVINAGGIMAIMAAWRVEAWGILAASAALLLAADIIYFSPKAVALKYLYPGLAFLAVFQLFVMVYTGYVAFTNYGTGHAGSKAQAVEALLIQNERKVEGSATYPLAVVRNGEELGFAVVIDDAIKVGSADSPLEVVDGGEVGSSGAPTEVPGWEVVQKAELFSDLELQQAVVDLRVPVSDDADEGSIRTREGSTGAVYRSSLVYDEATDTMTNVDTGVVYTPNDRGQFVAEDGSSLIVGWYVTVGFENFTKAVTDSTYSGPLLKVAAWTFAFAVLTVLTSFGLGLVLAMIFNDPRIKGRKVWRTLFILPYAFPAFMSALLWRGMLNPTYGIVNEWFFAGADISWLSDPILAKGAILWVNLWLSYPYWFLVATGALQAIPSDMIEAARIDGAGRWRTFRSITLPMLLVSTAPLAIASFAFSFNNFTVIYMLTQGGPAFADTTAPLGHTDILISAIYEVSGVAGGSADYGLASALSIVVFVVVGAISAIAFRQTRKLEEMM